MRAVWIRARAELRSSWASWLALTLVIGLAGGVAIAAVVGARRTQTAYPRFLAWSHAADVLTGGFADNTDAATAIPKIERLPEVAQWARVDLVSPTVILPSGRTASLPEMQVTTDLQNRAGVTIERFKLLSGRLYDQRSPDEAVVDFSMAGRYGLHVGSVLRVAVPGRAGRPAGTAPVTVVGVVAVPTSFPSIGGSNLITFIEVSPAFVAAHRITPDPTDSSLLIRLRHGDAGVRTFKDELRRAGIGVDVPIVQSVQTDQVQHSIRFETSALWIVAMLVAAAAAVILGQALVRQLALDARDFPVLGALGMSRSQLTALGVVRAAVAGLAAAALAVPVAVLLSPLTPIGLARAAEPTPGIWIDPVILVAGAVGLAVLVPLASAIPAWLAARSGVAGPVDSAPTSTIAQAAAAASPSVVASTGIRLALQSGRGRTAVPVRSAIFGATLAVAALVASVLFWSSLGNLLQTPRLAGFAWNLFVAPNTSQDAPKVRSILEADTKDIEGMSRGGYIGVQIAGEQVFGVITGGSGPASPVIVDGRAPASTGEIALGGGTMRDAHVAIGDTVEVDTGDRLPDGTPVPPGRLRVVGRAIVPAAPFGATRPDQGAVFTLATLFRIDPVARDNYHPQDFPFLVRFKEGVNADAALARLQPKLSAVAFVIPAQPPGSVATLGRIAQVPLVLAMFLAVIAIGTLGQVLVTSVLRRRRDLAMLKTLGFVQRQIRATVAWQATTLAVIALAIGVPVGLAAGRWGWRLFAQQIGVVPAPHIGPIPLLIAVPATILMALAVSFVPAMLAARTRPAAVLRSE